MTSAAVKRLQRGLSLVEVLITLALVTLLVAMVSDMLQPWIQFKQTLETERKLLELQSSFRAAYEANAYRIDSLDASELVMGPSASVATSGLSATRECLANTSSFRAVAPHLVTGAEFAQQDGYGNFFCLIVSPRLAKTIDGVNLYYHTLAIVSPGRNMTLDPGTGMQPDGSLGLDGDDRGALVDGYAIQQAKYKLTLARIDRVIQLYETYFTSRFLANPARDITVDYFASTWDTTGTVPGTGENNIAPSRTVLASLGIADLDGRSAYETVGTSAGVDSNDIFVANERYCFGTTCVRSPAAGVSPPYTALVGAMLPGDVPLVKSAAGNY